MYLSRLLILGLLWFIGSFPISQIYGQAYICDWSEINPDDEFHPSDFDLDISLGTFVRRPLFYKKCIRSSLNQVSVNKTLDRYRSVWTTIYNTYIVQYYTGMYGACDDQFNQLIPPKYQDIRQLGNNGWLLKKKGKWGAFSPKMKKITGNRFDEIYVIDEYSFLALQNDRLYLCDVGQGILQTFEDACFKLIGKGNHKVLCVKDNRNHLLYNLYGEEIADLYGTGRISILGDSLAILIKRGKTQSLITYEGETILPFEQHQVIPIHIKNNSEDLYYTLKSKDTYHLCRNKKRIVTIDKRAIGLNKKRSEEKRVFDYKLPGLIMVEKNGKIGFYNTHKRYLSNIIYEKFVDVVNCGIVIEAHGQKGLVDFMDNMLIPTHYEAVTDNINSVIIMKNGLYGLYDSKGNEIWPVEHEFIFPLTWSEVRGKYRGLYYMSKKFGLYDTSFQKITKAEYTEIKPFQNTITAFRIDKKWGLLNIDGNELTSPIFDKIISIGTDNISRVVKDGKFQKIDPNGNFLEGCQ